MFFVLAFIVFVLAWKFPVPFAKEVKQMDWRELKSRLLKDPEFKKEYDALEPEYRLLRAIIDQRIKRGLSQEMLANRVGTKQEAIARLESGRANPTLRFLKKVAAALDAELEISLQPKSDC